MYGNSPDARKRNIEQRTAVVEVPQKRRSVQDIVKDIEMSLRRRKQRKESRSSRLALLPFFDDIWSKALAFYLLALADFKSSSCRTTANIDKELP